MRTVTVSDLARYRDLKPGDREYVFGEWRTVPEPVTAEATPVPALPQRHRTIRRRGGFRPGLFSQSGNW